MGPPKLAPQFRMIDVGHKRITRRRAVATGTITVGEKVFALLENKALPKGDALALAEIAGIQGAKRTPDMLVMCHPLPLDEVAVHTVLEAPDRVRVYCQTAAQARTGVEMEALMGVQAALLTLWDLAKGTEPNLAIGEVRLLLKEGGKGGLWKNPAGLPAWLEAQLPESQLLRGVRVDIVVASDRAASGAYPDLSGAALYELLTDDGATVSAPVLVSDDRSAIEGAITSSTAALLIVSGGTGPGPRDVTPEAVRAVADRMLEGLGELLRAESAQHTDKAWLSRMSAAVRGPTLILAFPGSPKAVRECWEIVRELVPHALRMAQGAGHA